MRKILALIGFLSTLTLLGCTGVESPPNISELARVTQTLVAPPALPTLPTIRLPKVVPKLSRSEWR